MIVSCPSCRTRYRYAEAGSAPRRGRCSRCDETFDLAHRSRQYRLLPVVAPLPVGMDDPAWAPQLAASGRAANMVIPPREGRVASAGGAMIAVPRRSAHRFLREWFGLLLLTALGAAAGFHGAVIGQGDPLHATAAGTVGGLILGWSWIRAAERKR
jgi:predicted Zn finger-like uncharacterized protein